MPLRRATVLLLGMACAGNSQQIAICPGAAPAGDPVMLPITLATEGAAVAGIQFDITYDQSLASLAVSAGAALATAGKTLYEADLGPRGIRVLIAGLNQTIIGDGPVANVIVTLKPEAAQATHALMLATAFAASPSGDAVALATSNAFISVTPPPAERPAVRRAGVLSAATLAPGPVAPGEIVTITGSALEQSSGVSVFFDGYPAPLLYADPTQINAVVPYAISGSTMTYLQIAYNGWQAVALPIPVAAAAPGIFTSDGSGAGNAAALNEDGTVNGASNPARSGSVVTVFASGAGQMDPPGIDGEIAAGPLGKPLLPVSVRIGGEEAQVLYAGAAPGQISGVMQVNCRVPVGISPGDAPVVLEVGSYVSPAGVNVAVR